MSTSDSHTSCCVGTPVLDSGGMLPSISGDGGAFSLVSDGGGVSPPMSKVTSRLNAPSTSTLKVKVPVSVGVPEITPSVLSVSPAGRLLPAANTHGPACR